MKRKIRMGMVGGGQGSFIGAVHRIAANLDGQIELVCGCFSSRPENSLATGQSLFLPDNRIYASYQEMIEKEAALPEGERMDFVSISERTVEAQIYRSLQFLRKYLAEEGILLWLLSFVVNEY